MGIKSFLFNTDEEIAEAKKGQAPKATKAQEKPSPVPAPQFNQTPKTTFSEPVQTQPTFTTFNQAPTAPVFTTVKPDDELVKSMIENYRAGFASLNKEGYDFYEYYQSITVANLDYPQAFDMGKIMNPSISKASLLSESEFYLAEIKRVHDSNAQKGNARLKELETQKETESKNLATELQTFTEQLEQLKGLISDRQNKLSQIDDKYKSKLDEVKLKITANNDAAESVIASIETVKSGINNLNK